VGDREKEMAGAYPAELSECDLGLIEVLEHLDAEHEVEGVVWEGERAQITLHGVQAGVPGPESGQRRGPPLDARDLTAGQRLGEPLRDVPLSAPGVEQATGRERADLVEQPGAKPRQEPTLDAACSFVLG
jgi:hypothetical protein